MDPVTTFLPYVEKGISLLLLLVVVVKYLPLLVAELVKINERLARLEPKIEAVLEPPRARTFPSALFALLLVLPALAGCSAVGAVNSTAKGTICRVGDEACNVGQLVCDLTHIVCGDPAQPKPPPPVSHVVVTVRQEGAEAIVAPAPRPLAYATPPPPLAYRYAAAPGEELPPPPPPCPCSCANPECPNGRYHVAR